MPPETKTVERANKPGRKPKSEAQRAVESAADEIQKIDTALNLAEIERSEAVAKHKREVAALAQQRQSAVAKLRAATESLAKRVIPGITAAA